MVPSIDLDRDDLEFFDVDDEVFVFDPKAWKAFRVFSESHLAPSSIMRIDLLQNGRAISKTEALKLASSNSF
jgi:hypothetical protein